MPPVKKPPLFQTCFEVLADWTVQYHAEYGTAIRDAFIVAPTDPRNKTLIIAIRAKGRFPPHAKELERVTLYDTWQWGGESDKAITYPVIGIIEDGLLELFCGETVFKSFFSELGQLKETIVVNDPYIPERNAAFEQFVRNVEEGKKKFAREKNRKKKLKREMTSEVSSDNIELLGSADKESSSAVVERKREKRRTKDHRQKEHRKAAAEVAANDAKLAAEVRKHERKAIKDLCAMVKKRMDFDDDAVLVDPETDSGREYLEIAKAKGWILAEIVVEEREDCGLAPLAGMPRICID